MDYAIGEMARRAGYAVQTVRYYEQIGLMPVPPRTEGGQRRYSDELARRLLFIRHARDLGFTVEDVRSLLDLAARPDQSCASVDAIAETHLAAIDAKIASLKALRAEIGRMLECCSKTRIAECRVIDRLGAEKPQRRRALARARNPSVSKG
jgi:DNA-binding transcriptional MerR regulator